MDNTKLIERLRRMAGDYALVQREEANEPGRVYSWDNVEKSCWEAANALEAAEAELTRRDTVIAETWKATEELFLEAGEVNYEEDNYDAGVVYATATIRTVLAAAPVSLEAAKADALGAAEAKLARIAEWVKAQEVDHSQHFHGLDSAFRCPDVPSYTSAQARDVAAILNGDAK